jgi:hypothetical protein
MFAQLRNTLHNFHNVLYNFTKTLQQKKKEGGEKKTVHSGQHGRSHVRMVYCFQRTVDALAQVVRDATGATAKGTGNAPSYDWDVVALRCCQVAPVDCCKACD